MSESILGTAWLLRTVASALRWPTHCALFFAAAVSIWEVGLGVGERWRGLVAMKVAVDPSAILPLARKRVERADLLARVGPMLGLMGTLIPLGPGLAALGRGDMAQLAAAVIVAFDTTVLGLAIGIVGLVLGRLRRRWYDRVLDAQEARSA